MIMCEKRLSKRFGNLFVSIDICNKIYKFLFARHNLIYMPTKSKKTGQRLVKAARERKRKRFLLMTPEERKNFEREKKLREKRRNETLEYVPELDAASGCLLLLIIVAFIGGMIFFCVWHCIHGWRNGWSISPTFFYIVFLWHLLIFVYIKLFITYFIFNLIDYVFSCNLFFC